MFYKMEQEALNEECITYDEMKLLIEFQKLWFKVAIWLRIYIRAAIYNTPNLKAVTHYLLEVIPFEAYSLFSTYCSTSEAQNIRELLIDFNTAAMETITAMRYGDEKQINLKINKWYKNADKAAAYLSRINDYWDEEEWKNLLYTFISIKIDEINAVINDNYEEEMRLYNMIEDINFLMADYMTRGIIYQINNQSTNATSEQKIIYNVNFE